MSVLSVMQPMPDEPVTAPQTAASNEDDAPATPFFETIGASFRSAKDRIPFIQDSRIERAYRPLIQAVTEMNGKSAAWAYFSPLQALNPLDNDKTDYEALWRDIDDIRRRDPDALPGIAKTRSEFERQVLERGGMHARDARTAGRGGIVPQLLGGAGAQFFDPANTAMSLVTGGLSRGTGLARGMLVEGVANAGTEIVELPMNVRAASRIGEDMGAADMALDVGSAFVFGSGFHAAGRGAGAGTRAGIDYMAPGWRAAREAKRLELAPVTGVDLVRAFEDAVPENIRTFDETAALNVYKHQLEVEASNPFESSHAGMSAHVSRLDAATRDLVDPPPVRVAPRPGAVPVNMASAWRAIERIEGGTNPDGSFRTSPAGAIGPAQVMPGTAPEAARLAGVPFDDKRFRTDAAYNRKLGQAYYEEMLRQFDGDPAKAAAAYNAGPGSARRGTGVRGAMARAARAGRPDDWVSFLPAETRAYVARFREYTGTAEGDVMPSGIGSAADDGLARALDAEAADIEMRRLRLDGEERGRGIGNTPLPELRRDLFPDEDSWRFAQAQADADALGVARPVVTQETLAAAQVVEAMARKSSLESALGRISSQEPVHAVRRVSSVNAAQDVASREISGRTLVSADGFEATVSNKNLAKMRSGSAVSQSASARDHAQALANLDHLFAAATQYHSGPDLKAMRRGELPDQSPIGAVRQFIAPMSTPEGPVAVRMVVKDMRDPGAKKPLYTLQALEIGEKGGPGGMAPEGIGPTSAEAAAGRAGPGADIGDPNLQGNAVSRFSDPGGADAVRQADVLDHDIRAAADAGDLDGVTFSTLEEGARESARSALARLDDDAAAIEAIRGCL